MKKIFLIFALLITISSCSTVKVHYDKNTDFSAYRTFAYAARKGDIKGLNQDESRLLLRAVDKHVRQWPLQADRSRPDLLVRVLADFHKRVDVYRGYGPGPRKEVSKEGRVEVRMTDAKTSRVVWTGQFYLNYKGRRDMMRQLERKLRKMFARKPVSNSGHE